ncbi:phenylalanine--tRNA ligase subunit beta [Streptococcus merionis]|uniref:phenylalanine--tRNA ligase subunit beta n=1 Tax=Streptococcus merionis TaxID=400065 RepID=UPI0026EBE6CD|nr:phenylalanine--tRNA ligase subunit beta [Streptococcus merionis]
MLVSYKWLKQLVDVEVTSQSLAEVMSTTGIEVEGVTSPAEGLSKLVVGEVITVEDVPETHLHVCEVNIGEETTQIVCGAPNVKPGIKVIVALPGARIAGNHKIEKGKIRGIESLGMICSLAEIGISDSVIPKAYADGIYYLPEDAVVGDSIFPYLDMDDEIIELSITPNRADALSMRGVVHEVAAIFDKSVHFADPQVVENSRAASDVLSVEIKSDKVASYQARVVDNVTIAPSPQWLQNLLMNAGIRPLNNVVDITNYILLYFGQPMHAFDLDTFKDSKIVARQAKNGEKLVTLDEEERQLTADDIVIAVGDEAVALGGVMGGLATEITDTTKRVVLEAASFDGKSIRKTSSRLNLRSESSARFEKGTNVAELGLALDVAASLIAQIAGGEVLSGVVKAGELDVSDIPVSARLDYVNQRLGTQLDYATIADVFRRLGMAISGDEESFTVQVPRRRWDIRIPADLVEEIARIYGYDKLPTTLPDTTGTVGELTSMQRLRRQVRTLAEGAGLSEVVSYALTTPEKAVAFTPEPTTVTELMWPMTIDRSALRQNVVAGLLEIVAYNVARKNQNLALYEIGKIFEQTGDVKEDLPQEIETFALALTGQVAGTQDKVDFFTAKGIVEAIFDQLRLAVCYVANKNLPNLHPGRAASIELDGQAIGFIGQVHPATAKDYGVTETYVVELNLTAIETARQPVQPFVEISKFPSVSRDISMLLKSEISHQEVLDAIAAAGVKRLTKIELFDLYAGAGIEPGKKSMAYSLTFQNLQDSLTDDEVAAYMAKITKALIQNLDAEIR